MSNATGDALGLFLPSIVRQLLEAASRKFSQNYSFFYFSYKEICIVIVHYG